MQPNAPGSTDLMGEGGKAGKADWVVALEALEQTVIAMREDGHPYGENGGDEWFAILHERLAAIEVARG